MIFKGVGFNLPFFINSGIPDFRNRYRKNLGLSSGIT